MPVIPCGTSGYCGTPVATAARLARRLIYANGVGYRPLMPVVWASPQLIDAPSSNPHRARGTDTRTGMSAMPCDASGLRCGRPPFAPPAPRYQPRINCQRLVVPTNRRAALEGTVTALVEGECGPRSGRGGPLAATGYRLGIVYMSRVNIKRETSSFNNLVLTQDRF